MGVPCLRGGIHPDPGRLCSPRPAPHRIARRIVRPIRISVPHQNTPAAGSYITGRLRPPGRQGPGRRSAVAWGELAVMEASGRRTMVDRVVHRLRKDPGRIGIAITGVVLALDSRDTNIANLRKCPNGKRRGNVPGLALREIRARRRKPIPCSSSRSGPKARERWCLRPARMALRGGKTIDGSPGGQYDATVSYGHSTRFRQGQERWI